MGSKILKNYPLIKIFNDNHKISKFIRNKNYCKLNLNI